MSKNILSDRGIDGKTQAIFAEKLRSSGLTVEDARILKIEALTSSMTANSNTTFKSLSSLKLNYIDPYGKPLSDWPQSPPFYRIRYLEADTSFTAMSGKKTLRYVQEPATAPAAYYPANIDWTELIADVDRPIIITEGELKAAKACKEGFPAIGLGGVYNWRSIKSGITWIESLNYPNWVRRNVYICFDSDLHTNPNICQALKALAEALYDRGAFVYVVNLPALDGYEKVGLDDFLVYHGAECDTAFSKLLHEAKPLGLARVMFEFNERYIYIKDPGLVLNQRTTGKVAPGAFRDHVEATKKYQERVIKSDGTISYKEVSAAAEWIKWPLRYEADKLTYMPGRELYIQENINLYNIWSGWKVQPIAGDAQPFLEIIANVFVGAPPELKHWFLCWLAYPLQNPGVKMFTAAAIHGVKQGTGKSMIGYSMREIYGTNFSEINDQQLGSSFNEWAECKQFVLADDITGTDKRSDADKIKKLITQKELRVNTKFVPSYVVPDCINYLFTSNQPDAFFLEDEDRRMFIHETKAIPRSVAYYTRYGQWLDNGGASYLFHFLLNYDTSGFNPYAPALRTDARSRMISDVKSDLGAWVRQLLANADFVLRIGELSVTKDLFTSKELLLFYDPMGKTGTTANGLGRELRRAGVSQVCQGAPVRIHDGSQARYYPIRNPDKWACKPTGEVVEHLDNWAKYQTVVKVKY